jgi:hypothetical protein
MSNGDPMQLSEGGPHKLLCAHAHEADPMRVSVESFWEIRDALDMGDDSTEFLPEEFIDCMLELGTADKVAFELNDEGYEAVSPN